MKAREKAFYEKYKSTPSAATNLYYYYGCPSNEKIRAYDYCRELCYKKHGYGFKVTSAGKQLFSIGFLYDTVDEETGEVFTHCHYRTGINVYDFIVPCDE